jgi:hypothetical protein
MAFVRADASTCVDESVLAVFDDVGARSNGLQDTDTRQLRQSLLDEIDRLDAGDVDGSRGVLRMLAAVLRD